MKKNQINTLLIRTIVAIPLLIAAILYLFFSPFWLFKSIGYLLFVLCIYEYTSVVKIKNPLIYIFALSCLVSFDLFFISWSYGLAFILFSICIGLFLLIQNSKIHYKHLLTIFLWLALPWGLILQKLTGDQRLQTGYILIILATIITNDSGAYIGGTLLGKHKLAPSISPNKTIEGSGIGLICGIVAGFLVNYFTKTFAFYTPLIIILFILSIVGQIGDLFESKWKRAYNVKDSGKILPEHGGILDRIDAYLFVVPTFCFLLYFFKLPFH